MAARAPAVKALYAPRDFIPFGEGISKDFGFIKHTAIAMTLGMAAGFVYKSWHWNEKRVIAQYYSDLTKKEAKEENARQTVIQAKFKALEEELLA